MMNFLKTYFTLFIIACFVFTSCEGNEMSFNLKKQIINSCNSKGIRNLYIRNDSIADFYTIRCSKSTEAPKSIKLNNINKNYKIYKGWSSTSINLTEFKLLPNSHYIIERSQGDASSFKIFVTTNANGKIIKVSTP